MKNGTSLSVGGGGGVKNGTSLSVGGGGGGEEWYLTLSICRWGGGVFGGGGVKNMVPHSVYL